MTGRKIRRAPAITAVHVTLAGAAFVALMPLIWLICAAFKDRADLFQYVFLSPNPTLKNFASLFEQLQFGRYFANSLFVSATITLLQVLFSSMAGFALAKYTFRGMRVIMLVVLATMMIPYQILLAPLYTLLYHLHLLDTLWALILPAAVNVFGIVLFRQSMISIPDELLDAGRIDGCSELRLYWEIALPVTRPMIGAFTLIAFMAAWNNFLWPQIVLQTGDRFTLPIALNQMMGLYKQEYGSLMAGTLLSILPVILLFFMLQKEFLRGLTAGAVKG